jgi:hypothetical protein
LKTTQLSNHGKPAQSGKKYDAKDKSKGPDLSDKLGKDGKLKGDKQERHIKEGLCLYCGKSEHVAADCNKAAMAKACTSKVEPTESAVSKKSSATPRKQLHGLRVALTLTMSQNSPDSMHLLFWIQILSPFALPF